MVAKLSLPTFIAVVALAVAGVNANILPSEMHALLGFKLNTTGTTVSWKVSTGWNDPGTDPCLDGWYGVTCVSETCARHPSNPDGVDCTCTAPSPCSVIELNLPSNNLQGNVPPFINELSNLRVLKLWGNTLLGGSLADTFEPMKNLQQVMITNTRISGSLPSTLLALPNLQYLYLYANAFTGSIPDVFHANQSSLVRVDFHDNTLDGTVPDSIVLVPNLQVLSLSNNQLESPLPALLSNSTTLLRLYLSYNNFESSLELFSTYTASAPTNLECVLQSLSVEGNSDLTCPFPKALLTRSERVDSSTLTCLPCCSNAGESGCEDQKDCVCSTECLKFWEEGGTSPKSCPGSA